MQGASPILLYIPLRKGMKGASSSPFIEGSDSHFDFAAIAKCIVSCTRSVGSRLSVGPSVRIFLVD